MLEKYWCDVEKVYKKEKVKILWELKMFDRKLFYMEDMIYLKIKFFMKSGKEYDYKIYVM